MSNQWHESDDLIVLELRDRMKIYDFELNNWPDAQYLDQWTLQLMKKIECLANSTPKTSNQADDNPYLDYK